MVNQVMQVSEAQMLEGDQNFANFYYKEAHAIYIQAIEGYIQLLKITGDD